MIEFYDVPIYRLSNEEYQKAISAFVDPRVESQGPGVKQMWWEQFGGAWQFNEIIGFLRLHFLGSQVRAEWWSVKAKRITKTRQKQFEYKSHKLAPETSIPSGATNKEIWAAILEHLDDCRKELKGRYVDSSLLEVIGPHMNWQAVYVDA